ncbi:hypothetical protein M413DRAFT_446493 [Hebeloma cylindrosporum]|uniref:Uncharacterized protein n=1 Tax=Hebeloma cylindrosporum TaxID=76867 RepID=A0A0C2XRL9_HEBCY|nr:hypothetical protein M413DRAFT_446493 [Hebeloma cylindrosporum h7]
MVWMIQLGPTDNINDEGIKSIYPEAALSASSTLFSFDAHPFVLISGLLSFLVPP